MSFLRPFLQRGFGESEVTGENAYFQSLSFTFQGYTQANFMAQTRYCAFDPLAVDEGEDAILDETHRALSPNDMLEKLGLYGLHKIKLRHNETFIHVAQGAPLGLAVKRIDCGFAQAIWYEMGSDTGHLSLRICDRWDGSYFPTQIDRLRLWDQSSQYDVPLAMSFTYDYVEDILGIVDTTTQALLNDDESAYRNFALIHEVMGELKPVLSSHHIKTFRPS